MKTYGIVNIQKICDERASRAVEAARLVRDTSSCRVRSTSRCFVQRANQARCSIRLSSPQPPNFEKRDIEPRKGDGEMGKDSKRRGCKSAIQSQEGQEGILYTSFLWPTPPPSIDHIHPFSPLHWNHPDTFRVPLGPGTQLGKTRGGPRRPRLKIPGRNSNRRAELLVDWARHTSFPTRSGVREVQETNRRAETEEGMQPKLGDWRN